MEKVVLPIVKLDDIYYDEKGFVMPNIGSLKEQIVCLRPAHKSGIPQIYCERKGGKIISHNYCHSGNGSFHCYLVLLINPLRI